MECWGGRQGGYGLELCVSRLRVCGSPLAVCLVSLFVSVCRSCVPSSSVQRPPIPRWCPVRAWLFFTFLPTYLNSTNPMVPCERSFVAVAHTHTPRRTARPPTAPPRRERDEEMGQRRRSHEHVWEGSVVRHAARRFSLSGTAPPFRGRKVTATPYALLLLPRRRPPNPPSLSIARRADRCASTHQSEQTMTCEC